MPTSLKNRPETQDAPYPHQLPSIYTSAKQMVDAAHELRIRLDHLSSDMLRE